MHIVGQSEAFGDFCWLGTATAAQPTYRSRVQYDETSVSVASLLIRINCVDDLCKQKKVTSVDGVSNVAQTHGFLSMPTCIGHL